MCEPGCVGEVEHAGKRELLFSFCPVGFEQQRVRINNPFISLLLSEVKAFF